MKIDLTKEEIQLNINLLNQVNVKLDQADILLKLRNKYILALKEKNGET